jgi:hypothetical protein
MHMLLNDLLVAMVVVVMESNTYFQFSPPVDTSIESSLTMMGEPTATIVSFRAGVRL